MKDHLGSHLDGDDTIGDKAHEDPAPSGEHPDLAPEPVDDEETRTSALKADHGGESGETPDILAPPDNELEGRSPPPVVDEAALVDEIDEHLPLPVDGPYHNDDRIEPDPYDVNGVIDETMPRPSGRAIGEVNDSSTEEDLDVDTAPSGRNHDGAAGGDVFPRDEAADTVPADADLPSASSTDTPTFPPMGETTICPVCGRPTKSLRFCGYCGTHLSEDPHELAATSVVGRLQERAGMLVEPVEHWMQPGMVRFLMAAGGMLVLLALLANNGALALIFAAAILPLALVFWCVHNDVFDKESPLVLAAFGLGGMLIGVVLGWLSSMIVAGSWFDTGILNYGAAGFGGGYAERAGNAPFLVWTVVGILFPLLALVSIIGVPLAMRQRISLRNEVMDGLTLGAVMGAGYSIGTAIVFASPMLIQGGPVSGASDWTLTTIGLTVIRPLVWTLSGGLLGAAAWRYLLTGALGVVLAPAIVGAAAPLLFSLMSIQLSPAGLWAEILWGALVAGIVSSFYRKVMGEAIQQDRQVLGTNNARVVCPSCHRVTPAGQFCARCGSDLTRQ